MTEYQAKLFYVYSLGFEVLRSVKLAFLTCVYISTSPANGRNAYRSDPVYDHGICCGGIRFSLLYGYCAC